MKTITKIFAGGATVAAATYATHAATSWLRYGKPRPAPEDAADALLDRFMPTYDVVERHHVPVAAPAAATFAAARAMQLDDSRIVRAVFRARELILRAERAPTRQRQDFVAAMTDFGWGVLAEQPGEVVLGAATKPWQANPTFRALAPDAFAAFAEPDYVKIALTLRVTSTPDGGSVFRTETRAVATDAGARAKFRLYWSLLSPGIVVIRLAMVRALAAAADRAWHVEGDDLLAGARAQLTHATTIDASARAVWPWLVQMGCQRAGWYSWDILDNGGAPSADRIVPALQQLAVGDVLPARPVGSDGFEVLRVVPERALVLGARAPAWQGTWAFELVPLDGSRTRLVTRYRAAYQPRAAMTVARAILSRVHQFMAQKQLRTIKQRAEQASVQVVRVDPVAEQRVPVADLHR